MKSPVALWEGALAHLERLVSKTGQDVVDQHQADFTALVIGIKESPPYNDPQTWQELVDNVQVRH